MMPHINSASTTTLDELLNERALFTKVLLADTAVSYLKDLTFPEDPQVDLVAVHGLSAPFDIRPWRKKYAFGVKTWIGGEPPNQTLWLKDLLPRKLNNVRVLLFGYNSNVGLNTSTAGVSGAAEDLLAKLQVKRQSDKNRPIVFLCHSLGGIVIKRAISMARNSLQYQDIYQQIRAVAFFATPHRGGLLAKEGQAAAGILRRLTGNPRSSIMEALRYDSLISPDIHRLFLHCLTDGNIRVCSFYEAKPMTGLNHLVVDGNSAKLDLGEPWEITYQVPESDHSSICKYKGETEDYQVVIERISDLVKWALTSPTIPPNAQIPLRPLSSRSDSHDTTGSDAGTLSISHSISHSDLPDLGRASPRPSISRGFRDSQTDFRPFHFMPDITTSKFTGRKSILNLVQEILSLSAEEQIRVALYGLGGTGKTQIALKIAYWYRESYPSHSLFWLRAKSAAVFQQSLTDMAVLCGLVRPGDGRARPLSQVHEFLSNKDNGNWLIIIDNADSADTFGIPSGSNKASLPTTLGWYQSPPLITYIPTCAHGRILFTTNNKGLGGQLTLQGYVVGVPPMNEYESCVLLRRQLDEATYLTASPPTYQREIPTDQIIQKLAAHLSYLPLALAQAAAFMRQQSLTVTEYIALLENDDANLMELLEWHGYGTENDFSKAVASTWKIAFDQIESNYPSAAALLSLVTFLDAESIPKFLLKKFQPEKWQLSAIDLGTLQGYELLYPDPTSETYRMHRLVQLAMRKRLTFVGSAMKWADTALELVARAFPERDNHEWEIHAALVPHATEVLKKNYSQTAENKLLVATLATKISWYYLRQGQLVETENLSRMAEEQLGSLSKPSISLVLDVKEALGIALRKCGELDRAESLMKEALHGRKKASGTMSLDTVECYNHLAMIYVDQGRYDKAAKLGRSTLQNLQKIFKSDNVNVLLSKALLGLLLCHQGEYREAEELLHESVDAVNSSQEMSPDDPRSLKNKYRLAVVLHASDKFDESTTWATDTWMEQKRVLGENHPDCVMTHLVVANNLQSQEQFDQALKIKREIYSKAVDILGPKYKYTKAAADSLASCCMESAAYLSSKEATEVYKEADGLCQLVLAWSTENLRADHPEILAAKTRLATLLRLQGKLEDAEKMQREALKMKTGLGKEHPLILAAQENLARVLWEQKGTKGKMKEAEKLATAVLKMKEKKLGWSSKQTNKIAELLVEILADGKQKNELERRIEEQRETPQKD